MNFLKTLKHKIYPQPFDSEELENIYQQEMFDYRFNQVRIFFSIGLLQYSFLIIWDIIDQACPFQERYIRGTLSFIGILVILFLFKRPEQAKLLIFKICIFFVSLAVLGYFSMLMEKTPETYKFHYSGMMFFIAYIFILLSIPMIPAILFSLLSSVIMLIIGFHLGVSILNLSHIAADLSFMIMVGYLSRYQIENFSRLSFLGKKEAEKALLTEKEFLRNASHNLRQPMGAISNCTLALLKNYDDTLKNNPDLAQICSPLATLSEAVNLLTAGINSLFDVAEIDKEENKPTIKSCNINQLLHKLEPYQYTAKENVSVIVRYRKQSSFDILTNEDLLFNCLSNLVDNAIKYTHHGWVLIKTTKIKNFIRLHIIDTGIGIPDECKDKIFNLNYRVNEQSDVDGLGIGLSLVKKVIDKLPNHHISFHSKISLGTHFYIDIPIAEPKTILPIHLDAASIYDMTNKYVIFVDDDKMFRNSFVTLLEFYGCKVYPASSVSEARKIIDSFLIPPDLVITDYILDKRNNETAEYIIRFVKERHGEVPTIVITGDPHTGDKITFFGQDYVLLKKPISDKKKLLEAIKKANAIRCANHRMYRGTKRIVRE